MNSEQLKRIDTDPRLRAEILPHCRLKYGEVWTDKHSGHRVGVLDACRKQDVESLMQGDKAGLAVHDPPYNLRIGKHSSPLLFDVSVDEYIRFSRSWIGNCLDILSGDAHFYVWIGADQKKDFQPLAEFMLLMREFPQLQSRSFITMRNQRGYGTQQNWMAVRQELLYYTKGSPSFKVTYTDIPRILKGYYKTIGSERTENSQRMKSPTIRPGNVWVDIQQVFYRMEENIPGAYAQKPLAAYERLLETDGNTDSPLVDFFTHSGTSLIAAERAGRRCYTCDIDPLFAEISIRRLEYYRETGKTGRQWRNPFPELEQGGG
jgi:site-specific DNA-methyltransferase (adenine-specific)